ncbi:uncharacterized protein MELLADRAFT_105433 [Melampsora larici-populina 98AG31]|uniref:Secreted protein n=1 Tax=Melampsora larici-populina (strain 98AG31 / pathotype 3-4-7) TaxID=747676 RepID=F4RI42_MELLP|nr:uncharacterized protein MELLADRAFT_105433 [Melampsora larici-populina 98AG31]EGG08024.1 hypothetical protein MELLADRAFT_105433 [Melampsora larici-populina 98AG31]
MFSSLTLTSLACVILANLATAFPQRNPLEGAADVLKRSNKAHGERMSTLDMFYAHLEQCENNFQSKVQTNNQQFEQVNKTNSQQVATRLESNLQEMNDIMMETLDKMNSSFTTRETAAHVLPAHEHTMVEFCDLMIHFMSDIQQMYTRIHQISITYPVVQTQCQDQMQHMSTSLNNFVEQCVPMQGFNTQILATAQKTNDFFSLAEKTPFGFSDFMQNLQ